MIPQLWFFDVREMVVQHQALEWKYCALASLVWTGLHGGVPVCHVVVRSGANRCRHDHAAASIYFGIFAGVMFHAGDLAGAAVGQSGTGQQRGQLVEDRLG